MLVLGVLAIVLVMLRVGCGIGVWVGAPANVSARLLSTIQLAANLHARLGTLVDAVSHAGGVVVRVTVTMTTSVDACG